MLAQPVEHCVCDVLSRVTMKAGCSLGYGQLHVIASGPTKYKRSSRTSRGSDKWIDVLLWRNPLECIEKLQSQGRKVYVTNLSPDAQSVAVCPAFRHSSFPASVCITRWGCGLLLCACCIIRYAQRDVRHCCLLHSVHLGYAEHHLWRI